MPRVTITEAARILNTSRSTIDRGMRSGKIAYERDEKGVRWVDTSELQRIAGEMAGHGSRDAQRDASALGASETLIEALRERIADQERTISDLRAERDRLLALIEGREQRLLPAPAWWRRWLGR